MGDLRHISSERDGTSRTRTPRPELWHGEVTGGPDTPEGRRCWRHLGSSHGGQHVLLVLVPAFASEDTPATQTGEQQDAARLGAEGKKRTSTQTAPNQ
jgi:hypothetical protein